MDTEPGDQDQQQAELPTKRKRGRPPKWPRERRIDPIFEGRMSFKPGDPHPMDAQLEEAQRLREAITEQLAQVQGLVIELVELEDAGAAISREEQAITALLWKLYGNRKHRDHLVATFVAARRRRLLQRLQAAGAALEQAQAFLTADSTMLPLLQRTIAEAEAHAIALHSPPPPVPEPEEAGTEQNQADEEENSSDLGPTASTQPDQGEAEEKADERQNEQRRTLLHTAGGGDDAVATRAALAAFEERARLMRNAIAEGRGSFEWYYVKRPRQYTPEAKEYVKREEPIPSDVQVYEEEDQPPWGPYLRYRWWEGKERYSIGLGHIKRRDPQRSDEPPRL